LILYTQFQIAAVRAAELSRARTSPAQSSFGWSLGGMNADWHWH